MVGHTGNYQATIIGVESVDLQIKRLYDAVQAVNGIMVITADHGNADEMYEKSKDPTAPPKAKTSHTLNKVPLIITGTNVELKEGKFGLANLASTVTDLLGLEPDSIWLESVIK
jgi:2,3-bisphosphoglycerate-independent phosphoglycerate mutase